MIETSADYRGFVLRSNKTLIRSFVQKKKSSFQNFVIIPIFEMNKIFYFISLIFTFISCNKKQEYNYELNLKENKSYNYYLKTWKLSNTRNLGSYNKKSIQFPGTWRGKYFSPNQLSNKGYCNLEFILKNIPNDSLSLYLVDNYGAYNVYFNNVLVKRTGNYSESEKTNITSLKPTIIPIPKTKLITIKIELSSYNHRMGGGFLTIPQISNSNLIQFEIDKNKFIDQFSFIAISILLFITLLYYILIRRDKVILYFILTCIVSLIRQISLENGILSTLIYKINFDYIIKFRYLGFYLGVGFGAKYFYLLYPDRLNKKIINFIYFTSLIASLLIILSSAYISSYTTIPFQFFTFFAVGYVFIYITKNYIENFKKKKLQFFTFIIFLFTILFDIINTQFHFVSIKLQALGFTIFAFTLIYEIFYTIIEKNKTLKNKEIDIQTLLLNYNEIKNSKASILNNFSLIINKNYLDKNEIDKLDELIKQQKLLLNIDNNNNSNEILDTDFKRKLKENYPQLTKSEIEICYLIKQKKSTKQIAIKRNSTDTNIKVTKHRIRKKLNVNNSFELESLLDNIL